MFCRPLARLAVPVLSLTSSMMLACKSPSSGASTRPASTTSAVHAVSNDCSADRDPCACRERRALDLLASCFVDRAFEVVRDAPVTCHSSTLLGVKAEALAATGRNDDARALAKSLEQQDAKNRFARRTLGIVALNANDLDAAQATFATLLAEDAKDVDSLFYSALVNRRRDRYREARQGFLQVLRSNPRHIDARFNLATLTASVGAREEAQHHLDQLLAITPVGDPRLGLAKAELARGETPSANGNQAPSLRLQQPTAAPSGASAPPALQ